MVAPESAGLPQVREVAAVEVEDPQLLQTTEQIHQQDKRRRDWKETTERHHLQHQCTDHHLHRQRRQSRPQPLMTTGPPSIIWPYNTRPQPRPTTLMPRRPPRPPTMATLSWDQGPLTVRTVSAKETKTPFMGKKFKHVCCCCAFSFFRFC